MLSDILSGALALVWLVAVVACSAVGAAAITAGLVLAGLLL